MGKFKERFDAHKAAQTHNPTTYSTRDEASKVPEGVTLEEYIYVKHHDGPNAKGNSFKRDGNMERGINIFNERNKRQGGAKEITDELEQKYMQRFLDGNPNTLLQPAQKQVESPQLPIADVINSIKAKQQNGGNVQVKAYSRDDGTRVPAHTRSKPDNR